MEINKWKLTILASTEWGFPSSSTSRWPQLTGVVTTSGSGRGEIKHGKVACDGLFPGEMIPLAPSAEEAKLAFWTEELREPTPQAKRVSGKCLFSSILFTLSFAQKRGPDLDLQLWSYKKPSGFWPEMREETSQGQRWWVTPENSYVSEVPASEHKPSRAPGSAEGHVSRMDPRQHSRALNIEPRLEPLAADGETELVTDSQTSTPLRETKKSIGIPPERITGLCTEVWGTWHSPQWGHSQKHQGNVNQLRKKHSEQRAASRQPRHRHDQTSSSFYHHALRGQRKKYKWKTRLEFSTEIGNVKKNKIK